MKQVFARGSRARWSGLVFDHMSHPLTTRASNTLIRELHALGLALSLLSLSPCTAGATVTLLDVQRSVAASVDEAIVGRKPRRVEQIFEAPAGPGLWVLDEALLLSADEETFGWRVFALQKSDVTALQNGIRIEGERGRITAGATIRDDPGSAILTQAASDLRVTFGTSSPAVVIGRLIFFRLTDSLGGDLVERSSVVSLSLCPMDERAPCVLVDELSGPHPLFNEELAVNELVGPGD